MRNLNLGQHSNMKNDNWLFNLAGIGTTLPMLGCFA
jgi:hypothetical protein